MSAWLLLIVSLPPKPSSLRVRTWRKLRALGAVALKNSVYLLPYSTPAYERFQWLTQEVAKDGGEATLLKVDRIENMKTEEVIRLFREARDRDYADLAERYRKLLKGAERKTGSSPSGRYAEELKRLAVELKRLSEIDFFDAPWRGEVERLKDAAEERLRVTEPRRRSTSGTETPLESLKGKRWVTRPRPHVDRIASAWLIKRFIDSEATFLFAPPEEFPSDAVPFDALGCEFGHHGDDCTVETLLGRSGLRDRRLRQIAEIVHEADLRDQKFHRDEARGIDLAIRGLLAALPNDYEVLAQGLTLFDGLYAILDTKRT